MRIDKQVAKMVATNDRLVGLQWEGSDTFDTEIYLYRWHGLDRWRVRRSGNRGGATGITRLEFNENESFEASMVPVQNCDIHHPSCESLISA